uniref:CSON004015 protein n=1 Tax=Culicoides sonorensis TaxID=179676 RepID=A0A336K7A0_CULSO
MEREKTKHKQRRRKSKGQKAKVSVPQNLGTYKKPTGKPKQEFIDEEKEVKQLIEEKVPRSSNSPSEKELEIMFFESAVPPDENEETPEDKETSSVKTGDSIKSISNLPESPTHLASSYLGPEEGSVIRKFIPETVEYDDDLLYFPNLEEEQELETEIRNLKMSKKEEGLYEYKTPQILEMNRAQMINRCLEEKNVDCLKMIENGPSIFDIPLQFQRLERLYKSHSEKKFHPIFVKSEPVWKVLKTHESINKTLNIHIHSIVFESHPNLNENLDQVKKIKQLYTEYVNMMMQDDVTKLKSKLEGLRSVKDQMSNDDMKMEMCKIQIKETRNELHKKSKYKKDLILQILETWKKIKLNNKNPDIALKINCIESDINEAQLKWDEDFQSELNEVAEEAFDQYFNLKQEYKRKEKSNENKLEKPKKPDIEVIRNDLQSIWFASYRLPNEPEITLELQGLSDGTLKKSTGLKYFLKIFADNELITITKPKELMSDSNVYIDTTFAVRLTSRMVKDLKFEIFEMSGLKTTHRIAEIFTMIPLSDDDFFELEMNENDFTSKKIRGNRMNGKLVMKCGWILNEQQNSDKSGSVIEIQHSNKADVISQDMYKTWHQQYLIDPLDPESHKVIKNLHSSEKCDDEENKEKFFNLNEEELCFCSQEEIDNDDRLNMLRARFERDLKYKNALFVPSDNRELEIPEQSNMFEEIIGDPIDIQRHEGKKYLKKVYETVTNYCDNLNASREDTAILIGDQVPTFGSLSLTFFEIFGAKRPLKPTRRTPSSSKSGRTIELQGNFSIVVTIVRAFGVPQRNEELDTSRRNSNLSVTNKSIKGANVRPFVSISLKDKNVRTCTAEGFNPTWNEQLSILVNSKTDLNKSILSVDLFDEFIDDYMSVDDRRITEITQRWLGQIQFPLETIYQNQRIEGTFEMNTPNLLLGYNRHSFETTESVATLTNTGIPNMREVTYLSLFINIEPPLDIPMPLITIGLECIELEETKSYIDNWYIDLRNEFPKAPEQSPYILLQSGKKACITRFLGPLEIPTFDPPVQNNVLEYYVRRFVSLIPVYSSFNKCNGLEGVWLTNEQIFNVLCASPKDLGVLLTCYFLTLKLNAWLILGHGLPMGDTCFVLLKEENDYFIVDPTTGKKYESTTVDCPLKKVYALANHENFWANIQREKRVFMTLFDVRSGTEWKSLFKSNHKAPPGFLHNIAYQYKKSYPILDLQRTIELKLTKKINSWRTHRKTTWNRYVTEHLRKLLIELETESVLCNYNNEKHLHQLGRMFSNYKVTGFPLNFKYTNLSSIVHHLKCTGIHLNSENAEFALAVHVKDYPNNIISVWIFLASMTSK